MRVVIYLILVILVVICLIPIYIMVINATRSTPEIQQGISLVPSGSTVANWTYLTGKGFNIAKGFLNSSIIAFSATILTVYFSLMTAYALQVYRFKLRKFMTGFILALVLIPTQVAIVGFQQYMAALKMTNTFIPLIFPAIAAPAAVFFAKQYLESVIVTDLIDAARIDGCSEIGIFHRVMMPIAAPGAFTMAIFAFVASWNNFFTPFLMISKMDMYTLPMLVQTLRGDMYRTNYGGIYLGITISILPIIIVYAIFSKYIVSGIAMGALKE
jgi:multiple sugar transport system permease protein